MRLQVEAQEYFSSSDCPEYLQKSERRLEEERERVNNYMDPSTEPKITRVLESELIAKQVTSQLRHSSTSPPPGSEPAPCAKHLAWVQSQRSWLDCCAWLSFASPTNLHALLPSLALPRPAFSPKCH